MARAAFLLGTETCDDRFRVGGKRRGPFNLSHFSEPHEVEGTATLSKREHLRRLPGRPERGAHQGRGRRGKARGNQRVVCVEGGHRGSLPPDQPTRRLGVKRRVRPGHADIRRLRIQVPAKLQRKHPHLVELLRVEKRSTLRPLEESKLAFSRSALAPADACLRGVGRYLLHPEDDVRALSLGLRQLQAGGQLVITGSFQPQRTCEGHRAVPTRARLDANPVGVRRGLRFQDEAFQLDLVERPAFGEGRSAQRVRRLGASRRWIRQLERRSSDVPDGQMQADLLQERVLFPFGLDLILDRHGAFLDGPRRTGPSWNGSRCRHRCTERHQCAATAGERRDHGFLFFASSLSSAVASHPRRRSWQSPQKVVAPVE